MRQSVAELRRAPYFEEEGELFERGGGAWPPESFGQFRRASREDPRSRANEASNFAIMKRRPHRSAFALCTCSDNQARTSSRERCLAARGRIRAGRAASSRSRMDGWASACARRACRRARSCRRGSVESARCLVSSAYPMPRRGGGVAASPSADPSQCLNGRRPALRFALERSRQTPIVTFARVSRS